MKLSAMVYVSGPTECINDGARNNAGVVNEENSEQDAIIIGEFLRISNKYGSITALKQ
jgi:hypothetical protein